MNQLRRGGNVFLRVWIKFPVVVLATLLVCGMTYVVLVRYTPIGWLLNGKRSFP